MTIDEAIEQFKYDAECNRADLDLSYAEDNEQLAEWLEELKEYKQKPEGWMWDEAERKGYNKAIDDFTGKIKENISESLIWGMLVDWFKHEYMNDTSDKIVDYVIDTVKETAEQLKGRE